MTDPKTQMFLLLLIFSFASSKMMPKWNFDKGGEDWPKSCRTHDQAPIDIAAPFEFKPSNRSFFYSQMLTEYSFYNNGNNLILEGEFGYMKYNGETYFTSEILFYSPSLHTIGMHKMPFEMQIWHHDNKGNKLAISILFKYSKDYSLFLASMGFDDKMLRFQKPFQPKMVKGAFDLSKFVGNEKDFFYYESKDNAPPCKASTTYLILTDVLKISKEQLDHFPEIIKNKSRNIQLRRDKMLYTTFDLAEVQKKKDEVIKGIEKLRKKREEAEKFKELKVKLAKKKMPKKAKVKKLRVKELKKLNMTLNKSVIKKINQMAKNSTKNKTKEDNCPEMVPISSVKQRIKALAKYKQVLQVDIINNPAENRTETMKIDYDFPQSTAELRRLSIAEKESLLGKLYNTSKKFPKNAALLVQIDELERQIKLQLLEGLPEDNKYFSFLVMDNQILEESNLLEKTAKMENSIENFEMMKDVMDININNNYQNEVSLSMQRDKLQKENERLYKQINQKSMNITKQVRKSEEIAAPTVSATHDETDPQELRKREEEASKNIDEILQKIRERKEKEQKKGSLADKANQVLKDYKSFGKKKEEEAPIISKPVVVIDKAPETVTPVVPVNTKKEDQFQDHFSDIHISNTNKFETLSQAPKPNAKTIKKKTVQKTVVLHTIDKKYQGPNIDFEKVKLKTLGEKPKPKEPKHIPLMEQNHPIDTPILLKDLDPNLKLPIHNNEESHPVTHRAAIQKTAKVLSTSQAPVAHVDTQQVVQIKTLPENNHHKADLNAPELTLPKQQEYKPKRTSQDRLREKENTRNQLKEMKKRLSRLNSNTPEPEKQPKKVEKHESTRKTRECLRKKILRGKKQIQKIKKNDGISSLRDEIRRGKQLSQTYNQILKKFLKSEGKGKPETQTPPNEMLKLIKQSVNLKSSPAKKPTPNIDQSLQNLEKLRKRALQLNNKVNPKKRVHPLQPTHAEVRKEINSMTKKTKELLSKSAKIDVKSEEHTDLNKSYLTDLDFDKTVFNFLKIVYDNLGKELANLDKINQKMYGCENGLLNSEGYIKITKKNFALIVRKAYFVNSHKELNYDSKLNMIYDYAYKTLLAQSKLQQTNPLSELRHLTPNTITSLVNRAMQKSVDNQITLNDSRAKVKILILEMLQNLPLILITSNPNQKKFISTQNGAVTYSNNNQNSHQVYDNSILTASNSRLFKRTKVKTLILGPNIRAINQLKAPPGQGRKAVSRNGKIDPTEIFNIVNWPDACKIDKRQSPININRPYQPLSVGIKLRYKAPSGKLVFLNDGYKLILRGDFGKLYYGVHEYSAVEIHFHAPSEHTFGDDEKRSPLEMQIIHQDIFGNLAGVAVLFNLSRNENPFLKQLGFGVDNPLYAMRLRNSEAIELKPTEKLNLGKYLNKVQHYVHYVGSITSPPCNPNVQWFVLLEKLGVTQKQLEYFPVLFGMESNVRGLQVNHDRLQEII